MLAMSVAILDYKILPLSERIQLVEDIWDSIAEETGVPFHLAAEDRAEFDRRLAAHQTDSSTSIPWEQVRAELFQGQP